MNRSRFCHPWCVALALATACAPMTQDVPDGGAPTPDAAVAVLDPALFVTEVLEVTYGENAGFGQGRLPGVVQGPPQGRGATQGGVDVVSLGRGGSITLRLGQDVVDGPGPDFTIFENAFSIASGTGTYAEPARVEVSGDGVTFVAFPCAVEDGWPYAGCAGVQPVLSPGPNGNISPLDAARSGGDLFDLSTIGVTRIRVVRIVDVTGLAPEPPPLDQGTGGFDLDAVAILSPAPATTANP